MLEFTFTSEQSVAKAYAAKLRQYKEVMEALKAEGWKVELHVIIMGVRGWMPEHTWEALGQLGMSKSARQKLYEKLSELAVTSLIACVNTRRRLEARGEKDGTNKTTSGFVRFISDQKETKARTKQQEREQEHGGRKRRQPRKGEG